MGSGWWPAQVLNGAAGKITRTNNLSAGLVVTGGYLVAILLPLLFNPYSSQPVEAQKTLLVQGAALVMGVGFLGTRLGRGRWGNRFAAPDQTAVNLQGNPARIKSFFLAKRSAILVAATLLAIYTAATLFSLNPRQSFWGSSAGPGLLTISSLVIIFLLLANHIQTYAQADRLISGILIGSVPAAIYGCLQILNLDPLSWKTTSLSQVHSTLGYSLHLGAYLAMAIPFTLARLLEEIGANATRRRLSYALILALHVICLLGTLSRSALLAATVGGGLFLGMLAVRRRSKWLALSLAGLVAAGVILLLAFNAGWSLPTPGAEAGLPGPAADEVGSEAGGAGREAGGVGRASRAIGTVGQLAGQPDQELQQKRDISNSSRLALWKLTLPMLSHRWLLGYGPDTYFQAFSQHYPDLEVFAGQSLQYWDAHNLVLTQVLSAGILGLAAFGLLVVVFFARSFTRFRRDRLQSQELINAALVASVTAYLVQAQFNPSGIVPTAIFWLVMAIGVGIPLPGEADTK